MSRWYSAWAVHCIGMLALCAALCVTAACGAPTGAHTTATPTPSPTALPTPTPTAVPLTIALTSPAFKSGAPIPSRYTCQGANISPPLAWSGAPQSTASFLLLMDDVTGTGYVHWVVFNLPATTHALPENVPPGGQLANGARQGTNQADEMAYRGPCPALPRGATDTYVFTLYALDAMLPLDASAKERLVLATASAHMLARGQLSGTYMLHNS